VALLALREWDAAQAALRRAATASEEVGDAAVVVLARLGAATMAQTDNDAHAARRTACVRGGSARSEQARDAAVGR
jgi:hypothetical protein